MNENIKEILDNLKDIDKTSILKNNDAKIILNYITNLQQENQDIKDTLQDKLDYIGHLKELCDKYEEKRKNIIEYLNYQLSQLDFCEDTKARMLCSMVIVMLEEDGK